MIRGIPGELWKFVKKEYAVVGKRDFAGRGIMHPNQSSVRDV